MLQRELISEATKSVLAKSEIYVTAWKISLEEYILYSVGQLTSHQWPSFGKRENKGSVFLWYSCFDRSILMFLLHEELQSRISMLKHCLMRLWIDITYKSTDFLFSPLPKLGQLTSIDRENALCSGLNAGLLRSILKSTMLAVHVKVKYSERKEGLML